MSRETLMTVIYIYLGVLLFSVITAIIFQFKLRKSVRKYPIDWGLPSTSKTFRTGTVLILIYLTLQFFFESLSTYLFQYMCTVLVVVLNNSVSLPVLYFFFHVNSSQSWKKYIYLIIYGSMILYHLLEGYYSYGCRTSGVLAFLIYSAMFLGSVLHLSELLVNPDKEYYRFSLRITLSILIYSLLDIIINGFLWSQALGSQVNAILGYSQFVLSGSFYLIIGLIFISETRHLRSNE